MATPAPLKFNVSMFCSAMRFLVLYCVLWVVGGVPAADGGPAEGGAPAAGGAGCPLRSNARGAQFDIPEQWSLSVDNNSAEIGHLLVEFLGLSSGLCASWLQGVVLAFSF